MAAKRRKTKKQTLAEFRAWLEGVEEISGTEWTPDKNQWKTIRDRISNITEPEPQRVVVEAPARSAATPPPSAFAPPNAAPVGPGGIPPIPAVPSSFDRAGVGPGAVNPGAAPPPGAGGGVPTPSPIAQPDPSGVPRTAATTHGPPGTSFE